MKDCSDCGLRKPLADFYKARNPEKTRAATQAWRIGNPDAVRRASRKGVLAKYGLTPEAFDALIAEQGGRCAICGSDDPGVQSWAVDHDHLTGQVRGLLCWHCNIGLGHFRDDVSALVAAADYLMRSRESRQAS